MKNFFISFLLLSAFGMPCTAWAHGVKLFASVANNKIAGIAYFVGGGPAINSRVLLLDRQNNQILECVTNEHGKFEAPLPRNISGPHTLLLLAGPGHQAEVKLDFAAVTVEDSSSLSAPQPASRAVGPAAIDGQAAQSFGLENVHEQLLLINQQLLDIKAAQGSVTFEKIIAGLGYIMGLLGLAVYVSCRQRSKTTDSNKQ